MAKLKEFTEYRLFAEKTALEALDILQKEQKNFSVVLMKDAVDLATSADNLAERHYIGAVQKAYPDHMIRSEEIGMVGPQSDFVWVIDPLDGTKEYARGSHEYNSLISLEIKGELVACAIVRSGLDEFYSASKGEGAYLKGNPIHISAIDRLGHAFVGFHLPTQKMGADFVHKNINLLESLINQTYRTRSFADDAKAFGLVAQGVLEAHILPHGLNQWHDIASGILLVREAGGIVTDVSGQEVTDNDFSDYIIASNGIVHDDILKIINSQG
jgi:myo-inositol-1(or 4)-monophosphatase